MSDILVMVEIQGQEPKKQALAGIAFGQALAQKSGGTLSLAVLGHNIRSAAEKLSSFAAANIFVADAPELKDYTCEAYTQAMASIVKQSGATTIAASSSSTSKDFLPRLAARLDAAMASDVMAIVDAKTFKRPMWAGNATATVELTAPIKVCTVRATEFDSPKSEGQAPLKDVALSFDTAALGRTKFVTLKEIKSARPDVTTATRVVSGGRGVKGPDGFKLVEALADKLGAGVGASRAVCDAGWVPNDLQIGQTGKVVAPNLYIAIGISGAIQHLAGMKGSKVIVAINKDAEAPIFQVADFGLVADLFQALPELSQAIG